MRIHENSFLSVRICVHLWQKLFGAAAGDFATGDFNEKSKSLYFLAEIIPLRLWIFSRGEYWKK